MCWKRNIENMNNLVFAFCLHIFATIYSIYYNIMMVAYIDKNCVLNYMILEKMQPLEIEG